MKKLLTAFLATFLVCSALGACGSKGGDDTSSSSIENSPISSVEETSEDVSSNEETSSEVSSEDVSSNEESSAEESSEDVSSNEESSAEVSSEEASSEVSSEDVSSNEESSVEESSEEASSEEESSAEASSEDVSSNEESSAEESSEEASSEEESSSDEKPVVSGSVSLTLNSMGLEGAAYSTQLDMTSVNGYGIGFLQLGDYGYGMQMRTKNGVSSAIWNISAFPAPITKIVLTHNDGKSTYDDNAYKLDLGTTADLEAAEKTVSTSFVGNTWTINVSGEYTYFQLTHANGYTQYWDSIVVYYGGNSGGSGDGENSSGGNTEIEGDYVYNDFTAEEKAFIQEAIGGSIPFLPNNEYYLEEYDYADDYGIYGINFYTFENTEAEFNAYLNVLNNAFTNDGTGVDEYGDTCYYFSNELFYLDVVYYEYYDEETGTSGFIMDLYAYYEVGGTNDSSTVISSEEESSTEDEGEWYTDFTAEEKAFIQEAIGSSIPFLPNAMYVVEEYADATEGLYGVHFYTFDNTAAEFNAYLDLFDAQFYFDGTDVDEYGDTWYFYSNDTFYVNITHYEYNGYTVMELYAYVEGYVAEDSSTGNSSSEGEAEWYTDFTADEKATIQQYIGGLIPFIPNAAYAVEPYENAELNERGINFYTAYNTQEEFDAYRALFSDFTFDGTDVDEYGDTWYFYNNGTFAVDMAYYLYEEGVYLVDVYAYVYWDGSESGSTEEESSLPESSKIISSEEESSVEEEIVGVRDIDFTKATNVKDVTDQGYYLDGCPTVGEPTVLVIPVEFSDIKAASKGYSIEKIKTAFNGATGSTDYYSVHDYYYRSSFGQLDVQFTVLDNWFQPSNTSNYYAKQTMDYFGDITPIGDQMIMNEALAYLDAQGWDLSKFDSDGNGTIDAIVMITTLDIDDQVDFQWAYRSWNIYDDAGEYDNVYANDYLWASYQFMHESDYGYTASNSINTYTYIHEFGHVLGADDYYDTSGKTDGPLESYDIMDSVLGDHNAFSKFNYGWVTQSRLIIAEDTVTVTLDAFYKAGDSLIIANNWDDNLGAYQDYFVIVYYTNDGLNAAPHGYFDEEGIVVYHVNSTLTSETEDGETYYDLANNNTDSSDSYGTKDNLIEYVKNGYDFVYGVGDSLSNNVKDDSGAKVPYTFYVSSLNADTATLVFSSTSFYDENVDPEGWN